MIANSDTVPLFQKTMLTLGKTIRKFRESRKMTQRELAEESEVSISFLSQIENDRREPSSALVNRIAAALDIPVEILVWDALQPPDALATKHQQLFTAVKDVIDRYARSL